MTESAASGTVSKEIYEAFRRMKEKDYVGAESILKSGLDSVDPKADPTRAALFLSTLGVLAKIQGDSKEAWRCYEQAEKLLPEDPSLKIIMSKLLIDRFAQYDNALRKLKQVLKIVKGSGSFEHQAHATMAIAYLKKGDRKKASQMLEEAMVHDFAEVSSAENINFEVIEAFLARNFDVERCRHYVEKALALAKQRREEKPIQFLTQLKENFSPAV